MNCGKVKYPCAIKKRVKGDWNCENCMNLNFSFRKSCNLCGHFKNVPVLFPCAIYYNISTLFPSEQCSFLVNSQTRSLPDIQDFIHLDFMKKPAEIYLLNERSSKTIK